MVYLQKKTRHHQRHWRSRRQRVRGTHDIPRLVVFRSLQYFSCQVVDDTKGHTLCSASSQQLQLAHPNVATAIAVGQKVASQMKKLNILHVRFDRNGYLFTGRVAAFAGAVRDSGIKF